MALIRRRRTVGPVSDEGGGDLVDVNDLLQRYTVDELAATAEGYFARLTSWEAALANPFYSASEAPDLLIGFGALLAGLELANGHDVLDFGVGSGWTSWMMSQLGCRVIASDVSTTALEIVAERYRRQRLSGDVPSPTLLRFDGHRFDLPDGCVDRVVSHDAFHHVANPQTVLCEFGRLLRPGGMCVMSEPGPEHSRFPQSQSEMRNFKVVERNIILDEITEQAGAAGFDRVEVAIYCGSPTFVPADEFSSALAPKSPVPTEMVRSYLTNRRLIRLHMHGSGLRDSRRRETLTGQIEVDLADGQIRASVRNASAATWLQGPGQVGHVNLGAHLFAADGRLLDFDFLRLPLRPDGPAIEPGESLEVSGPRPVLAPGRYRIVFDLVSEGVCWFADNGGSTVSLDLQID
jgi:2-polyprenyl-3-methyl-5-hydroxy-6-metoxy-1,4-benzoquinol methylase